MIMISANDKCISKKFFEFYAEFEKNADIDSKQFCLKILVITKADLTSKESKLNKDLEDLALAKGFKIFFTSARNNQGVNDVDLKGFRIHTKLL